MDSLDIFEVLVRENTGMLTAFIRAGVGSTSAGSSTAVDDIWQETMLTAWRRWDDYDRSRPFAAWLRGIAGKNILTWHRKRGREPKWCDDATLNHFSHTIAGIQQLHGDTFQEKLEALHECIQALPTGYHDVIRLRFEDDLMPAAVADALSSKTETVKKQLQRAKGLLFDCISRKITRASPQST